MTAWTPSAVASALAPGAWKMAITARGPPLSRPNESVVRAAELDAADVAHAHERAVRVGAHDDVGELLGLGQPALGLDVELELLRRRVGWAPMRPTAAWMFWPWSAVGDVVRRQAEVPSSGRCSSQTRML